MPHHRFPYVLLVAVLLLLASALLPAAAYEVTKPQVDTSPLPASAQSWAEHNPLRGNAEAIRIGQSAFNQVCAQCHGPDANASRSPAPDLRRMGLGCRRVQDAALRQRCESDADYFFVKSVRQGKQKFGITHMPPWEGILEPEVVWAIRTFVENAPQ